MRRARPFRLCVAIAVASATVACGSDAESDTPGAGATAGGVDVVASFYPLRFVAERVGGSSVVVTDLTPAGVEPHDLELTARDTARLQDADLVVYLGGFSPAIDEAVDAVASDRSFDVAATADLVKGDPHFWLDPTRLSAVVDAIAEQLALIDPDDAETYDANAARLRDELQRLDDDYAAGLADCASDSIVTSHTSFGYLAARYELQQIGIAGLTPDEEPSPGDLADVADFVAENGVTTIYYETLVSADIAETIADETGATAAVLDPLEGLASDAAGSDYLAVMRANLETLRTGQGCR